MREHHVTTSDVGVREAFGGKVRGGVNTQLGGIVQRLQGFDIGFQRRRRFVVEEVLRALCQGPQRGQMASVKVTGEALEFGAGRR